VLFDLFLREAVNLQSVCAYDTRKNQEKGKRRADAPAAPLMTSIIACHALQCKQNRTINQESPVSHFQHDPSLQTDSPPFFCKLRSQKQRLIIWNYCHYFFLSV
jgi:hypothetical protein